MRPNTDSPAGSELAFITGRPTPCPSDSRVEQVISFIESRVPREGTEFRTNPFSGVRFHYPWVARAIDSVHQQGRYLDLEPFDLKGTLFLWNTRRGKNFELAWKATSRLLLRLRERQPLIPYERLLPGVTYEVFCKTHIDNYGTTLGSMLANVYDKSPYRALKDLIDHAPPFAAYRDLEPQDMRKAPQHTWATAKGSRGCIRALALVRRFLEVARRRHPKLPMEVLLARVESEEMLGLSLSRYGSTVGGMLDQVYGRSPYLAFKDLAKHDPAYRRYLPAIERRRYRSTSRQHERG